MNTTRTGTLDAGSAEDFFAHAGLAFDRGVPRSLVHKMAVSEVLLTDAVRTGPHRFTVAAQWPQHHVLFGNGICPTGTVDPLLLLETVRQTGIYLSHVHYDVPRLHPFVLTSVDYELEPPAPRSPARTGPHCVLLDVVCTLETDTPGRFGMSLDARVVVDGRIEGRVGLCWQAVSPARYERLRYPTGHRTDRPTGPGTPRPVLPAPAAPAQTFGRFDDRDGMLSGGPQPDTWELRLDTTHPVYFDHGCDHIPGMALIESFAQAATLASGRITGVRPADLRWTLDSGSVSFLGFGELDGPVRITAEPVREQPESGTCVIRVQAEQEGKALAVAVLIGTVTAGAVTAGTGEAVR